MSQLNTAPLINPTVPEIHPNQQMLVKEPAIVRNFTIDDIKASQDNNYFSIPQMDWIKFSQKNKVLAIFNWTAVTPSNLYRLNVDFSLVNSLIPVGQVFNSYYNFNTVTFSIKPTANAFVQGLACVTWIPAPTSIPAGDFRDVWGYDYYTTTKLWQIPRKFFISPNNTDEYNFTVPVTLPFNFFKWGGEGSSVSGGLQSYFNEYSFGTISIDIVVPFSTKTDIVSIPFVVSAQLTDLQTSGIKFLF